MGRAKNIVVICSLIAGVAASISWFGVFFTGVFQIYTQWELLKEVVTEEAIEEYQTNMIILNEMNEDLYEHLNSRTD